MGTFATYEQLNFQREQMLKLSLKVSLKYQMAAVTDLLLPLLKAVQPIC